jgi:hypothetical protein
MLCIKRRYIFTKTECFKIRGVIAAFMRAAQKKVNSTNVYTVIGDKFRKFIFR